MSIPSSIFSIFRSIRLYFLVLIDSILHNSIHSLPTILGILLRILKTTENNFQFYFMFVFDLMPPPLPPPSLKKQSPPPPILDILLQTNKVSPPPTRLTRAHHNLKILSADLCNLLNMEFNRKKLKDFSRDQILLTFTGIRMDQSIFRKN